MLWNFVGTSLEFLEYLGEPETVMLNLFVFLQVCDVIIVNHCIHLFETYLYTYPKQSCTALLLKFSQPYIVTNNTSFIKVYEILPALLVWGEISRQKEVGSTYQHNLSDVILQGLLLPLFFLLLLQNFSLLS